MHAWQNFGFRYGSNAMLGVFFGTVAEASAAQSSQSGASSSGSLITPSASASRANGAEVLVAPLGVTFDATATTAAALTSRPFHDLEYRWDFGDTANPSATWQQGTLPGVALKNVAFGPVAAHVYESAGTFTPTLVVRHRLSNGTFDTAATYTLPSITVTDADTEFAGTKTVCYSTNTDFTGAPAGCVQVPNVTSLATSFAANKGSGNKRHLLHAGQTFTGASVIINVAGPSMFGKFGSGAKPIVSCPTNNVPTFTLSSTSTPTTARDWRFVDLAIDNNYQSPAYYGAGSTANICILRNDCTRVVNGVQLVDLVLNALNTPTFSHPIWDDFYFVDSSVYDLPVGGGPNGIFGNATRFATMGNLFDNNGGGEHCIRFHFAQRNVYSHNSIQNQAAGKHLITIRGLDFGSNATVGSGQYSEKNVVSHNKFTQSATGGSLVTFTTGGTGNDERGRDMLVERNWFVGNAASDAAFVTAEQPRITVRNNLVRAANTTGTTFVAAHEGPFSANVLTQVNVYNNSIYKAAYAGELVTMLFVSPESTTLSGTVFDVRNNILYTPSFGWDPSAYVNTASGATVTESNNTTAWSTSPLFATNPPTAPAHFIPGSGSYANGAGTGTNVGGICTDFFGTTIQTTPDMGAVVIS